jgi:hypothetical protein
MYRESGEQSGFSHLPARIRDNVPDNRVPENPENPENRTDGQPPGNTIALSATPSIQLKIVPAPREFDPQHPLPVSADVARRSQPERKSHWRRLAALAAGITVLIAVSSYGWHYWTTGRFEESTDDGARRCRAPALPPQRRASPAPAGRSARSRLR